MNQNQIDSAKDRTQDILKILETELPPDTNTKTGTQLVDINSAASPAVLSGILGCNVAMIYQYRQDGKLPPNSDASYRDAIKHHVLFWKTKSTNKASSMADAALIQKTQLDRAKTEAQWLSIKKERGELVDTKILAEVFEPYFLQLRQQLASLARKYPDLQQDIDSMLGGWERLGQEMLQKSEQELEEFIQNEMDKEIEMDVPDELE